MIMNSDKKIVCVRDIPSNIIEEAIFILKENVVDNQDESIEEKSREIILTEAEDIVDEYINKIQYDNEEYTKEINNKIDIKKEIFYISGLLIILGICISTVI